MVSRKRAVVPLSEGIDSSTCFYWAKRQGWDAYALTFMRGGEQKREALKLGANGGLGYNNPLSSKSNAEALRLASTLECAHAHVELLQGLGRGLWETRLLRGAPRVVQGAGLNDQIKYVES